MKGWFWGFEGKGAANLDAFPIERVWQDVLRVFGKGQVEMIWLEGQRIMLKNNIKYGDFVWWLEERDVD